MRRRPATAGRLRRAAAWAAVAAALPAALAAAEARVTVPAAHVGSWGVEVWVGKDCAAADQLLLDAAASPIAGLYEACLEVAAEQVEVGAAAVLRSGGVIALGNDFSVPDGVEITLEIDPPMGSDFAALLEESPLDESVYNAAFYLDHSGLLLGGGDEIEHFTAYSGSGEEVFRLTLEPDGTGGVALGLAARQDGGGWIETAPGQEIPLPSGWSEVEVAWTAANGAGELRVTVAGGVPALLAGLDNGGYTVETVRWGAITGSIAASTGLLRLDAFSSWR